VHEFEIKFAQWELDSIRAHNRLSEEEAQAKLRFVQRGGNMVALNNLRDRVKQLLEACNREGDKIYDSWWASEKKVHQQ